MHAFFHPCFALVDAHIRVLQWLRTAPPKRKKVEQAAAMLSGEDAEAFNLQAFEEEERRKKQAAAEAKAREQEELDRKNAERDAEIAKAGKRAAGGMHKFDPDEVDVHGGDATADDFLDAFGFDSGVVGEDTEKPDERNDETSTAITELVCIKACLLYTSPSPRD